MRRTLLSEPGNKGGTRSAGGVNRIMSILNTVLSDLVEAEYLDGYPKIKPLKENNTRTVFFTKSQVQRMIDMARKVEDNQELAEAIQFGVFTGCRQGELLELAVSEVDLESRLLTFLDTKNGEHHVIDIHPELLPVLEWRVQLKEPHHKVFDFRNDDDLRNQFYKVRDLCGIDDEHVWHSLRHTTATWLAERGVPIQTIAHVLNHKRLETTERYTKVTNKARKTAIELL
jgi:integrase